MKVHFDQDSDGVYFKLDDSAITDSEEVKPGIILDFNEHNQIIGIEILRVRDRVPEANLKQMQFEVVLPELDTSRTVELPPGHQA